MVPAERTGRSAELVEVAKSSNTFPGGAGTFAAADAPARRWFETLGGFSHMEVRS